MKLFQLNLIIAGVLVAVFSGCNAYEAYNANDDKKFEFRMFENFGLTQEIFVKEQVMVAKLRSVRDLLSAELKMFRTQLQKIIR